jgi:DNA helicase-2/ATP-dependent DNA helicase PcrA
MANNFLKKLNQQQQKAVTYKNAPLLILAGAGSGKTRALTYRAAWLALEKKIDPSNILLVTFTNKAANEMKQRINKLLSANKLKGTTPFAGTFHSFCARILRKQAHLLGIPHSYLIYDKTDQLELIKQIFEKIDIPKTKFKPAAILNTISSAKYELITPQEYSNIARGYFQETAARAYLLYQNLLRKYEALDFGDLIFKTVQLFEQHPRVLNQFQNSFPYLLVDEYHDTNHAQYRLTKLLAQKHQNLTVVADCSQSIYGWRGADFKNVLNLKKDFPNLQTIKLDRNYRSQQNILDAAYAVISNNSTHPILKLWTSNDPGNSITIFKAQSEKKEAQFIINTIQSSIIASGSPYSDFAVLYRTNAQSRVLEEAFLHAGIPYVLYGGQRFYERKEIKDCLAYLRIIASPQDKISFSRLEKIGKKRLKDFLAWKKNQKVKKLNTHDLLDKILKKTKYLDRFNPKDEQDLQRIDNIKELFSVCREFPKLEDFLENVALVEQEYLPQDSAKINNKKNAVNLMTLHSAKGLEFKTVFITGMEEGLFPHSRSMLDRDELEEERRLAYVGITRAKENLYLTYAHRRLFFGTRNFTQTSRFISEIPSNLINYL